MNKLKELRKLSNKTQDDIAALLNTTQATYSRYEQNQSEPTIDTLCKLADYYNVSLDYLIGRDFKNEIGYLTENEKFLINDFRKLKPINQLKIVSEIKGMLLVQE